LSKTTSSLRYDRGQLKKAERLPNGWLRADASLTRSGVFLYRRADGSTVRELRHPDDVFDTASMDSLKLLPLTLEHPPTRLDSSNTKTYQRGATGENPVRDSSIITSTVMVTDAEAVDVLVTGKAREVSMGYTCDVIDEPGFFQGEPYDARQTNIRYNHAAIVERGRAGAQVRVHLDRADAVMVTSDDGLPSTPDATITSTNQWNNPARNERRNGDPMQKIRIDGVEYEATEQVAQAVNKLDSLLAESQKAVAATKAELEKATCRADVAEEKLKKTEQQLAEAKDPAKLADVVRARGKLERIAVKALGDTKLDEMDDAAIKRAVVAKQWPELKLDSCTEAYVQARFDIAAEALETKPVNDLKRDTDAPPAGGSGKQSFAQAREKWATDSRDFWKQPLAASAAH
jgi:hypothetical protein